MKDPKDPPDLTALATNLVDIVGDVLAGDTELPVGFVAEVHAAVVGATNPRALVGPGAALGLAQPAEVAEALLALLGIAIDRIVGVAGDLLVEQREWVSSLIVD